MFTCMELSIKYQFMDRINGRVYIYIYTYMHMHMYTHSMTYISIHTITCFALLTIISTHLCTYVCTLYIHHYHRTCIYMYTCRYTHTYCTVRLKELVIALILCQCPSVGLVLPWHCHSVGLSAVYESILEQ